MHLFQYLDSLEFLAAYIKSQPRAGHGQMRRIAEHLKLSSSTVSLMMKGERQLSEEQGLDLAQFLGLNARETEYFILLIRHSKAGSDSLKRYLMTQIRDLQHQDRDLARKLPQDAKLSPATQAVYYSDWSYAAARVAIALPGVSSSRDIAERLSISKSKAKEVCDFLIKNGLLLAKKDGLKNGPIRLHLEAQSPWIKARQLQWRLKGFGKMEEFHDENLFYTAPMSLSKKAAAAIRAKLTQLIQEVGAEVTSSEPTELFCLNMDWFAF